MPPRAAQRQIQEFRAAAEQRSPAVPAAEKPPRPISRNMIGGIAAAIEGALVLGVGMIAAAWGARHGEASTPFADVVVCLGAVVGANLLRIFGAYRFEKMRDIERSSRTVMGAWMLTIAAIFMVASSPQSAAQQWLGWWLAGGLAALLMFRIGLRVALGALEHSGRLTQNVAVVGADRIGQMLLRQLRAAADPSLRIVGVYDDRVSRLPQLCVGHPIVGTVDDLVRDARRRRIDLVLVALPLSADWRLAEIMNKLSLVPTDIRLCPDQFGFQIGACGVTNIGETSCLNVLDAPLRDWRGIAKDIEDRVLGSLILALIAPLLFAIAALIKFDSPGPAFFRQKRYGYNNQLFEMIKFRTMYHHASDANAEQLTRRDDPRVTRIGAFLRRTSLDELPQFINVLRGEMSIVGPRPHALSAKAGGLLYQDAVRYYDSRHRMKPGITGWAQVNNWRGETETVEQIARRVEHDLYYVDNWSLWLDIKIIVKTVFGGFTGHFAY